MKIFLSFALVALLLLSSTPQPGSVVHAQTSVAEMIQNLRDNQFDVRTAMQAAEARGWTLDVAASAYEPSQQGGALYITYQDGNPDTLEGVMFMHVSGTDLEYGEAIVLTQTNHVTSQTLVRTLYEGGIPSSAPGFAPSMDDLKLKKPKLVKPDNDDGTDGWGGCQKSQRCRNCIYREQRRCSERGDEAERTIILATGAGFGVCVVGTSGIGLPICTGIAGWTGGILLGRAIRQERYCFEQAPNMCRAMGECVESGCD